MLVEASLQTAKGAVSGRIAPRARAVAPLRTLAAAGALSLALGALLLLGVAGKRSSVAPSVRAGGFSHEGLLTLPLAAQGPVSQALGAARPAYRVTASDGGFAAANPAQRLGLRFGRSGVSISSGITYVGLTLQALGFGRSLTALGEVSPRVKANRVVYSHPGVGEWYVNGPLGLEQGFTIPRAPSGNRAGRLTLSMVLSGNARGSLASGGQGIILRRAGGPSLRYGGLSATDAQGRVLPSRLALQNGRLLVSVDARGARYPLRIDPFILQGHELEGVGGPLALSADGNTALFGGSVFTRSAGAWTQQATLLTDDGGGVALSADGDTALIGAPGANSASVFTRSGSTWTQQGEPLTGGGEVGPGEFGHSVALSSDGNTAVIGAPVDGNIGAGPVGAAWIFVRSGSTWTQQGEKLIGSGTTARGGFGAFGTSVALSGDGNTALIGGPREDATWVFTRSGEMWTQQEKLTVPEPPGAELGVSVALSGDGHTALIGGRASRTPTFAVAWVFTFSGTGWSQEGELRGGGWDSLGAAFGGMSVGLSADGDTAVLGDAYSGHYFGGAWVFTRAGSTWTEHQFAAVGEAGEGFLGTTAALSSDGSTALIGAPGYPAVWVFESYIPNPPEFGICAKVKRTTGRYSNPGCTTNGTTLGYEWYPAFGTLRPIVKAGFATKIKELTEVKLETKGKASVSCTGETGDGTYSTVKTVGGITLTLTGCHRKAVGSCQSAGGAPGEIVSTTLTGELGMIEGGKTGLDLRPAGGEVLAEFSCADVPVQVTGSVIVQVKPNSMLSTDTLKFAQTRGVQHPTHFEGGPEDVLDVKIGEKTEQAGLASTLVQTNEEEVEANSVF